MVKEIFYESYPYRILCLSMILTFSSYALGTLIIYLINSLLGVGYVILCFVSLLVCIKYRCSFCYYYGKKCYSGLGALSKLLFRQGNSNDFKSPKNLMPTAIFSFAVLFLPLIGAIVLMIFKFSWLILILSIIYLLIAVIPVFILRKNLFCKYCKQGKTGCPAYEGMQGKEWKIG